MNASECSPPGGRFSLITFLGFGVSEKREYSILSRLNSNPFQFIQRNLTLAPVVGLRCPRELVVGDVLRGFKRAVVLQVRGA
jgi:hypothetical protein